MSDNITTAVDDEELTAFVAASLRAIASGVQAADITVHAGSSGHWSFDIPRKITFDVAVTAKRTAEAGGGLKVQVFSIGAGVDGKSVTASETVSRLAFDVHWTHKSQPVTSIPSMRTAFNK